MSSATAFLPDLELRPLVPERWTDLEALFGEKGACGGCWCMWWRIKRSEFEKQQGAGNKKALKSIVDAGQVPGLLFCAGGEPIAWCSVAPREQFPVLDRSRTLKRVDDEPVWSVVCFFVARPFRGKGVTIRVLRGAVDYARKQGARIVEGYPVDPRTAKMPDFSAFTGLASVFREAGFVEVARRSESRPIMRYVAGEL